MCSTVQTLKDPLPTGAILHVGGDHPSQPATTDRVISRDLLYACGRLIRLPVSKNQPHFACRSDLPAVLRFLDLRATRDCDWGGLVYFGTILADERGGHFQARGPGLLDLADLGLLVPVGPDRDLPLDRDGLRERAKVAVCGERAVGALGKGQFEARDRLVGDCFERAARDTGL